MNDYEKAFKSAVNGTDLKSIAQTIKHQPCNCMGPQNGHPLCPCAMRNCRVVDGRWVRFEDLGPVKP